MARSRKVRRKRSLLGAGLREMRARLPAASDVVRAARVGAVVVGGLTVLTVFAVVFRHIRDEVEEREQFQLDSWTVELGELPDWVTPTIRGEILSGRWLSSKSGWNLFQRGVLGRLRGVIESQPWVREVRSIHLRYPAADAPGAIIARLRLRVPVATVYAGGLYYLTDGDGARLGEPYPQDPGYWFRTPVIAGATEPMEVPVQGERWTAADVLEGVSVALVLAQAGIHDEFPDRPIVVIEVSNVRGRQDPRASEIALLTPRQRLEWGRSPLAAGSRALRVKEKIRNLRTVLRAAGTLQYQTVSLYTSRLVGSRG